MQLARSQVDEIYAEYTLLPTQRQRQTVLRIIDKRERFVYLALQQMILVSKCSDILLEASNGQTNVQFPLIVLLRI